MKKILVLLLALTPLAVSAQSKLLRGMVVGSPPDNMATIDSIKYDSGSDQLFFYYDGSVYVSSEVSDSISLETVAHMITDTLQFVFEAGSGEAAVMSVGALLGSFKTIQDSIVFDSIVAQCFGAGGDITLQVQYGSSLNSSGTGIHTALNITTAGGEDGTSTFSTTAIGPGNWLWCEPTVVDTQPTYVVLILFYHEKRAS